MRKPHPGKGAIKLKIEIVSFSQKVRKPTSHWEVILAVKQARDFLLRATGKRIGQNSLYYLEGPKLFPVPSALKVRILPPELLADISKAKYLSNILYIQITPHADTTTKPEQDPGPETRHPERDLSESVPKRSTIIMDESGRKDMGSTPGTSQPRKGRKAGKHTAPPHEEG